MKTMTVKQARRIVGVTTDYALAKTLGINRSSVTRWNGKVPKGRMTHVYMCRKDAASELMR